MMQRAIIVFIAILLPVLATAQEWTEHLVDADFTGAGNVVTADVNGDGDMDILGAANGVDDINWWENSGGEIISWVEHSVDADFMGANGVAGADVDGDGDIDVLGAAFDASDITWWENVNGDGLTWTAHIIDAEFGGANDVFAEDVDGDGDIDVLGAAYNDDDITWWENVDGSGLTWTEHAVNEEYNGAFSVSAMDVDGDGDIDVLGAGYFADDITWWENMDGSGLTWTEHIVAAAFDGARSVFGADMDGDSDIDILGAAYSADDITWWENIDGGGLTWTEHTVADMFDGARSVFATDMDGDGDTDVLGAGYNADDITLWTNVNGDGLTWTELILNAELDGAIDVYASDINSDGDIDIVGASNSLSNSILWWEQPGIYDLTLTPWVEPVYIFPNGGMFMYAFTFTSFSPDPLPADVWFETVLPNQNVFQLFQVSVTFPADQVVNVMLQQDVPSFGPAGTYLFTAKVGQYPNVVYTSNSFEFTKLSYGRYSRNVDSWATIGWNDDFAAPDAKAASTNSVTLAPASPNPFNPSTMVTVSLPEASDLTVVVYNTNGQQVAELANGQFNAGNHRLTFDASNMASGLYFVVATVPGELDAVQKIMLVR